MSTPLPPKGVLVIDSKDEGHVIATYNPVMIAVFARPPADGELERMGRRAKAALEAGIPGALLYVVARREMSGGVSPKVRAFFENMVAENQDRAGPTAVVVLADGFPGALVRGAVASIVALFSRRDRMRVFNEPAAACKWLAQLQGLDAGALVAAFGAATAHLTLRP